MCFRGRVSATQVTPAVRDVQLSTCTQGIVLGNGDGPGERPRGQAQACQGVGEPQGVCGATLLTRAHAATFPKRMRRTRAAARLEASYPRTQKVLAAQTAQCSQRVAARAEWTEQVGCRPVRRLK